ncbi:WD40 repeat [Sesbania bispinosa]|nr:WD40 repeat [Sesbania bispinosa]
MAQSNWEADKMLDVYIYDYLVKKKLHITAKSFMTEGKVSPDPVAIDAPGGFLFEWWSVFWDIFIARTNEKHSENAAAYLEAQQIKAKEQQQLHMQQLQLMRQAQLQRRDSNHPPLGGPVNAIATEGMLGQSTATALATKMYEERMKHSNPMDTETSQPLLDARMALLKPTNHPGQMVPGNSGSVTAALQQIQARTQQTPDIKGEVNMGTMQRSLPMDPSSVYGHGGMQSKPGITNAGLNPGVGGLTLKGWPLTGIDQIRPGFGAQVQKPLLQSANQFQLLPQQQQQQILAQVQAQGNIGNSPVYGDMDPQRLRGLARGNLNVKDGQQIANDGSIGSPMQSTSSKCYQWRIVVHGGKPKFCHKNMADAIADYGEKNLVAARRRKEVAGEEGRRRRRLPEKELEEDTVAVSLGENRNGGELKRRGKMNGWKKETLLGLLSNRVTSNRLMNPCLNLKTWDILRVIYYGMQCHVLQHVLNALWTVVLIFGIFKDSRKEDLFATINMPQIQQSTSQQQQDPLHPQQLVQNNRKRKGPTSSGAANSTGTGNTLGPSNSQPSTPSTHTPGDGVAMAGNLQNVAGVSKGLMMYGTEGAVGLASSTNQLDDIEHFGDVESFLSQDDGDGRELFAVKRNPSDHATDASKGFSFSEVGSIRKSNSKVVCCHFSSDGKLLASAGHDKKVEWISFLNLML